MLTQNVWALGERCLPMLVQAAGTEASEQKLKSRTRFAEMTLRADSTGTVLTHIAVLMHITTAGTMR